MSQDDDDKWLEGLNGGTADGTPDVHEARVLRAALLRHASAQDHAEVGLGNASARQEELIARARSAGLLPNAVRGADSVSGVVIDLARRRRTWAVRTFSIAAAVLLTWVVFLRAPIIEPPDTVRSAGDVVRIEASEPEASRDALLEALQANGVQTTPYDYLGRHGIDGDLTQPVSAEVITLLDAYGLHLPPDGTLRIEFVARDEHAP